LPGDTASRKLEHLRMVASGGVESRESTLLEYVRIVHRAAPEVNLEDVRLDVDFCGVARLRAPLMITGMTGGHPDVAWVNEEVARAAEELGIAVGVGSQRAAIEDSRLEETFRVARRAAPNAVLVANLGAPQLALGYGAREARRAIRMIDADAIAIHLNPGQEAFQDEGDPYYRGVVERIAEIVDAVDVPVIVKETGTGLSREVVRELRSLGVKCFDVAGLGGTNWIKIEVLRSSRKRGGRPLKPAGPLQDYWGNPTAIAVVEARVAAPDAYIIGSGGVRNGLDAAKVIALGADIAGVALPALRALMAGGRDGLRTFLESVILQLRAATYMAGEEWVLGLWRAPLTMWGRLREELEQRGIDVDRYLAVRRLEALAHRTTY